jgi:uncharacterized protein (DUF488 family)
VATESVPGEAATDVRPGAQPIFTIGHSTRSIPEFVRLLQAGGVQCVVDVRTVPRSRANPQYNADSLPGALAEYQIAYRRIPELGGLRGRAAEVAPEVNGFWVNQSFHNYADHALTEAFHEGLRQLVDEAAHRPTAIMCAEAVWWRCHRRIIADYLLFTGWPVFHLMAERRVEPARITPAAMVVGSRLHYPADQASPQSRSQTPA